MKKTLALILALVMVLSLCACGAKTEAPAPAAAPEAPKAVEQENVDTKGETVETTAETQYAETVVWGRGGDLDTPDPYGGTSAQTEEFTNATFDTLIYNDPETGEMVPELAKKWEANADNTEWTFYLEEGVKFHDGSDFTAEDVAFTFVFAGNRDGATNVVKPFSASLYGEPEVIDDYTIKFVLNTPMADFPAYMEMKVYSKSAVEADDVNGRYIGTGPYFYDESLTTSGVQFAMSKNHDYWRNQDLYKTEHIICKNYGDNNTMFAALEAGEIDYCFGTAATYTSYASNEKVAVDVKTGCQSDYMGFNFGTKTCDMNDIEIRKAICQCINKDDIVAVALEGIAGIPSYNFCAPSGLGYAEIEGLAYDPEAGAATLAAKGVNKLTLVYYGSRAKHAEVIQANLAECGVDVELRLIDGTNWTTFKAAQEGYDIFLDYASYRGALLYNFNRFLYRGGSSNVFGFGSDDYEALQDNVTAQTNWDDMVAEFAVLQQWVADNVPLFPTVLGNMFIYRDPNVGGGYLGGSENACDWSTVYKVVA